MKKQEEPKVTYINETNTMFQENGQLHLINDEHHVIFNCDTLYNDLWLIVKNVVEGRREITEHSHAMLKEILSKL